MYVHIYKKHKIMKNKLTILSRWRIYSWLQFSSFMHINVYMLATLQQNHSWFYTNQIIVARTRLHHSFPTNFPLISKSCIYSNRHSVNTPLSPASTSVCSGINDAMLSLDPWSVFHRVQRNQPISHYLQTGVHYYYAMLCNPL